MERDVFDWFATSTRPGASGSDASYNGVMTRSFEPATAPREPVDPERYFEFIRGVVCAHASDIASPRCMGHMTSALPEFVRPLADTILACNQNLVKRDASRTMTLLERQTIAMLHRLVYRRSDKFYGTHAQADTSTLGIFSSGGTLSNITALWIARNACFSARRQFRGIEEQGLPAALEAHRCSGAAVIGSSLMHYSFAKAAAALGLGSASLIAVPVDERYRLDPLALRATLARCQRRRIRVMAIVATAGTTDCGSIDPIGEIADVARGEGIHLHVDAAWGGALLFSGAHRSKLAGIDLADSVTLDAHKQFYSPIGSSVLLLRDPRLAHVIEKNAGYMLQEHSGDLGKRSLEGSRAATSLFVHAALHLIAGRGYEALVDASIANASAMAERIRSREEFELTAPPETNILLYRYLPAAFRDAARASRLSAAENEQTNEWNEVIQREQASRGRAFVSRTAISTPRYGPRTPIVALRAVVMNPATKAEHIDAVLDEQVELAAALEQEGLQCVRNASEGKAG
jgi:glutamate decarboxylase